MEFADSTVFVTGGAGFIGSHVTRALVNRGTDVYIADDYSAGNPRHVPEGPPERGMVRTVDEPLLDITNRNGRPSMEFDSKPGNVRSVTVVTRNRTSVSPGSEPGLASRGSPSSGLSQSDCDS